MPVFAASTLSTIARVPLALRTVAVSLLRIVAAHAFRSPPETTEESFHLTVDSIPGLVCTMSAAGEAEFVNQQFLGKHLAKN
jgi:hypothetical protein